MAPSTAGYEQESTELPLRKRSVWARVRTHIHTHTQTHRHAYVRARGIHTSSTPERVFLTLAHNARLSTPGTEPGHVVAGAALPTTR